MAPDQVPRAPLSRRAIEAALQPGADPSALRRVVRALGPLIRAAVVRHAHRRPTDDIAEWVAARVEAIIAEWFAAPERVLLAPRPGGANLKTWFAQQAALSAERVAPLAWQIADQPRVRPQDIDDFTRRFVRRLGPWERTVFDLIYVQRQSPTQAATALGIDLAVLTQARRRLRARLADAAGDSR